MRATISSIFSPQSATQKLTSAGKNSEQQEDVPLVKESPYKPHPKRVFCFSFSILKNSFSVRVFFHISQGPPVSELPVYEMQF